MQLSFSSGGEDQEGGDEPARRRADEEGELGAEQLRGLLERALADPERGIDSPPEVTGEALELIARGWGNPAIAQRMSVSPKTVRNLVSNIFSKLQVADRAEAIAKAREAGLGGP